jgi:eukaryotic-like serine/threonine-protein kinase
VPNCCGWKRADDRKLIFSYTNIAAIRLVARKDNELWYLALPDFQAKPYLQPKWIVRNAQFSPDGKWVAYSSNETGNWEVYVSSFPNGTSKWQVSRGGGEPRWRRDGKELFYLSAEGKMMAVP